MDTDTVIKCKCVKNSPCLKEGTRIVGLWCLRLTAEHGRVPSGSQPHLTAERLLVRLPAVLSSRHYADCQISVFTNSNIDGFAGKNWKLTGISDRLRSHSRAATSQSRPCQCGVTSPFSFQSQMTCKFKEVFLKNTSLSGWTKLGSSSCMYLMYSGVRVVCPCARYRLKRSEQTKCFLGGSKHKHHV